MTLTLVRVRKGQGKAEAVGFILSHIFQQIRLKCVVLKQIKLNILILLLDLSVMN